jgi:hypothetical protein
MLIFFIFLFSKIRVSPTGIVSSLSPPWCCHSSDWHHQATAPCHDSFPLNQDELAASASSSSNVSSHRFLSGAKTETFNLHHHSRPPSSDHPTLTLYCYKKIISTLVTHLVTQSCLHFASSLARASRHWSYTCHRCSFSPLSHTHHPSKIHVSLAGVVSSLSSPRCHHSSSQHCHVPAPCHTSFPLNQDELAISTLSSGNASSRRLPSWAETEILHPHHHSRPPFRDRLIFILHCYKNIISIFYLLPSKSIMFSFTVVTDPSYQHIITPMLMN